MVWVPLTWEMCVTIWDLFRVSFCYFLQWDSSAFFTTIWDNMFGTVSKHLGGLKYFLFSTLLGDMIQFEEHIFQMGWFNHQPVTENPQKS